jgi:hypothetical protein
MYGRQRVKQAVESLQRKEGDQDCLGCYRYREGIAKLTEDYEAEIERLQEQLEEAWDRRD